MWQGALFRMQNQRSFPVSHLLLSRRGKKPNHVSAGSRQRPMSRVSASFGACMPFLRLQVATRPTGSHSPRKKRPHRVSAVTVPDERELCSPGVLTRSLFKIASQLLRSSWASDRVHPLMNDPFPM